MALPVHVCFALPNGRKAGSQGSSTTLIGSDANPMRSPWVVRLDDVRRQHSGGQFDCVAENLAENTAKLLVKSYTKKIKKTEVETCLKTLQDFWQQFWQRNRIAPQLTAQTIFFPSAESVGLQL